MTNFNRVFINNYRNNVKKLFMTDAILIYKL